MGDDRDGIGDIERAVDAIASRWRDDRAERQRRRHLDRADFDELRDAGLLRLIVPGDHGGAWADPATSARRLLETYRRLARADPSVALVSAMHPAVINYWLAAPDIDDAAWHEQRSAVFASALAGDQWGTITSEPGSGGDIARTRSTASPTGGPAFLVGRPYGVTGGKHFGSGSGVTDRMITTAIADGETEPMIFVLDVRDRPWDGTAGLTLAAEWDGVGMAATQSHAMHLATAPAVRMAWPRRLDEVTLTAGPLIATLFTAVVLGVLDEAVATARRQVSQRATTLRPFEQVEWTNAELDHWVATQAYEGAVRAVEGSDARALHAALRAKQAVAELAESSLRRLTRTLGGGTFSQRSPFAHWFEDVRALGFLRPPWALAHDGLFLTSLDPALDEHPGTGPDREG